MAAAPLEKYQACLVLCGSGDALGYKNGSWEFGRASKIWADIEKYYGGDIKNITISLPGWSVSDDTVMHIATAEALATPFKTIDELYQNLARAYITSMDDMGGRAPGNTCIHGCEEMQVSECWAASAYRPSGGGCGGSMRSMCIGLRFFGPTLRDHLVAVAIESGRMTHHHPTGYLGSLVSALFTAYAIEGLPIQQWGAHFVHDVLPRARRYVESCTDRNPAQVAEFELFTKAWTDYLALRQIEDPSGTAAPVFPVPYGVPERDAFYTSLSRRGWGGEHGHDSVLIAYDALLGCGGNWVELVHRACLHSGDSDSTGAIACAWYGALYGFAGVPPNHYAQIEYRSRMDELGNDLWACTHPVMTPEPMPSPNYVSKNFDSRPWTYARTVRPPVLPH